MIHEDYIVRIVKQLAKAISRIIKLKESHKYQEALITIDQTFQQLFGLNSELFSSLSVDSIINFFGLENLKIEQKCFWIADLINEEAEIHESKKDIQISKSKYLKSLELYLEGIKYGDNSIITDYFKKIKKIINQFEEQELPTEIKIKLLRYYEKIENYSKVEDLLFRLLKLKENKQELVNYGISFYSSLMAKSDQELINMNLSRDKVINSKLRLEEIKNLP